jgi:hypothetical protein
MSLIRIDHDPPPRQLAVFAGTWLVFFAGLGLLTWFRGGSTTAVALLSMLAITVPALGWVVPGLLRMVYVVMAYLAFPIGFLVSYLLLTSIYYLVLTPTGLLMRMLGHDPMNRRFDPAARSYWVERKNPPTADRYFRQF